MSVQRSFIESSLDDEHAEIDMVHLPEKELDQLIHDFRGSLINIGGFSSELSIAIGSLMKLLDAKTGEMPNGATNDIHKLVDGDISPCLDFLKNAVDRLDENVSAMGALKPHSSSKS